MLTYITEVGQNFEYYRNAYHVPSWASLVSTKQCSATTLMCRLHDNFVEGFACGGTVSFPLQSFGYITREIKGHKFRNMGFQRICKTCFHLSITQHVQDCISCQRQRALYLTGDYKKATDVGGGMPTTTGSEDGGGKMRPVTEIVNALQHIVGSEDDGVRASAFEKGARARLVRA